MKKEHVKRQLERLKAIANNRQNDSETTEITMIFYDVFKFLVERAPTKESEVNDED